ncbi:MAG: multifunctional CCA addition/repair protein [Gammaproteobacteria bacterium]|nr:multifunctional CCA addition/repair protein [Gammaproteobacteria bacterium]
MKTYLVGGAVRDQLLKLPVKDRDWVVVGANPEQMLAQKFVAVGKDFPVFLHPKSKEEYALARTERKSGKGYTGFECFSSPGVSVEEDLLRRDLTINAIAQDEQGQLVDPYGGQDDLNARILRHVSPAFREDPLRILRVARFAARFYHLGFRVADETMALMTQMTADDELQYLAAERVWSETQRALCTNTPSQFFEVLRHCGALAKLFPEIDDLFGVPQPEVHHPEIDTGLHTMMSLKLAAELTPSPVVRFAVLTHDVGKGSTPQDEWPRHIAHEEKGGVLIDALSKRLRVPSDYSKLAKRVAVYHTYCHRALELKPATMVKTLEKLQAYRQPEKLEDFLIACEADARGRKGFEERVYPQAQRFRDALHASYQVDTQALVKAGYAGKQLGEAVHQERVRAVKQLGEQYDSAK